MLTAHKLFALFIFASAPTTACKQGTTQSSEKSVKVDESRPESEGLDDAAPQGRAELVMSLLGEYYNIKFGEESRVYCSITGRSGSPLTSTL